MDSNGAGACEEPFFRPADGTKTASFCDKPGDANGDNAVNLGDAVFVINYIFKGGPILCLARRGHIRD